VLLKIEIRIQFFTFQKVQEPFFSTSAEFLATAFPIITAGGSLLNPFCHGFEYWREKASPVKMPPVERSLLHTLVRAKLW
jgi:hypothetical protein